MSRTDRHRNADCTSLVRDNRLRRIAKELATVLRPGIRLLASPYKGEAPLGGSRLGGQPDLPIGMPWPTVHIERPTPTNAFLEARPDERRLPADGRVHLAFIGQINLEEARPFDVESRLPPLGLLYFFYNPQSFSSDVRPAADGKMEVLQGPSYPLYGKYSLDNWQVVYSRSTANLGRRDFPPTLHKYIKYKPFGVTFRTEQTVPSIETSFLPKPNSDSGLLNLTEEEWEVFRKLRYDVRANLEINQMLGFADQWSTTIDEGSYWQARKTLFPDSPEWGALSKAERIDTAKNIRLLLQVESFDESAEYWGRSGSLYFFIRDTDLDSRDFSKVWGDTE